MRPFEIAAALACVAYIGGYARGQPPEAPVLRVRTHRLTRVEPGTVGADDANGEMVPCVGAECARRGRSGPAITAETG
jgi:hypothetical protein